MKNLIRAVSIALLLPAIASAQGRGDQRRGQQPPPPPPPQQHPAQQQRPAQPQQQQPPHQQQPQVGGGFIPRSGPPAYRGRPQAPPQVPRTAQPTQQPVQPQVDPRWHDQPSHPDVPHVHPDNTWVGHNTGRADINYRVTRPWPNGRFTGAIGPQHVWRLRGGTASRFDIGGFFFEIAPYDIGRCRDWLWDTDDIVIYNDPDHIGWYLAYNVRLGTYCHAEYIG